MFHILFIGFILSKDASEIILSATFLPKDNFDGYFEIQFYFLSSTPVQAKIWLSLLIFTSYFNPTLFFTMTNFFNRRKFLQTSVLAGSSFLWSPLLKAEILHSSSEIGKSKWDLESPALCVDLDLLEKNLKAVHTRLQGTGVEVRPHIKTHKCPALAKMQLAAGAIGVCAAKLSESEMMLNNGIDQVLMTGVNVTASKIKKAMALKKQHPGFIQAVDNPQNARDLQDAAKAAGIVADVVVDIDVIRRSGITPGEPALSLAQMVDQMPNLQFKGILAYDGGVQHVVGF